MLASRSGRAVVVILLLAVMFGLMVGYGTLTPAPSLGAYPSEDDLAANYDGHIGQPVQVLGTVVETDPVVIATQYDYYAAGEAYGGTLTLTVTDVTATVSQGQVVQVYGVARPDHTVTARTVVTVPVANFVYMYGISMLAGLWVLVRLARDWRLDWQRGALTRREDPPALVDSVVTHVRAVID